MGTLMMRIILIKGEKYPWKVFNNAGEIVASFKTNQAAEAYIS